MSKGLRGAMAVGLLIALGAAGCSTKKKGTDAGAGTGVSEEGLPAGSSLEKYREGLPPGEEGPLKDIHFAFDSYELDEPARSTLRDSAAWLKDHGDAKVEVEGHCDERGTVEYNLALGAKRARGAKEYLAALGVSGDRLTTISYGEELPLCHEHDDSCWQRNRRVHFVVLSE